MVKDFRDYCPDCGEKFAIRQRCPNGKSWCPNGHCFNTTSVFTQRRESDGRIHTYFVKDIQQRLPEYDKEI